jgi:hypothetical protein
MSNEFEHLSSESREQAHLPSEERIRRIQAERWIGYLGRKCRHEAIVGMGKIHGQVMRLLLHTGNHHQRFAEIGLRLARGMGQRNKHLPLRSCSPRT